VNLRLSTRSRATFTVSGVAASAISMRRTAASCQMLTHALQQMPSD
jgi:hypothetical protein